MSERLTFNEFMAEHHLAIDGKYPDNPNHPSQRSHKRRAEEAEAELLDYLNENPLEKPPILWYNEP